LSVVTASLIASQSTVRRAGGRIAKLTAADVLGRVDELTDGTGGSVDAVMGVGNRAVSAIGPLTRSALRIRLRPTTRRLKGRLSVTKAQAQALARAWIEAFNNHDLEQILSHYADSVELKSLLVTKLLGDPAGTVRGKPALRSYFAKGLAAAPDLRFELLDVFAGVSSVAVYLRSSVRGLQLEVMELDADGRIVRVLVHHRDP
jgi:hypothetical protein